MQLYHSTARQIFAFLFLFVNGCMLLIEHFNFCISAYSSYIWYNLQFSFHLTLKVHKRSSLLSSLVNKRVDKCTRVYFIHACYHQHFCKPRLNPLELPLGRTTYILVYSCFRQKLDSFFIYLVLE